MALCNTDISGEAAGNSGRVIMKGIIVVLSSIEWGFLWQRHQTIAKMFADAGWEVVFVESSAKRNPGIKDVSRIVKRIYTLLSKDSIAQHDNIPHRLSVISPVVLPSTFRLFRIINKFVFIPQLLRSIKKLLKGHKPLIVWCYLPTETSFEVIERLSPDLLIYDCVTNYLAMGTDAPKDIADTESRLIKQADFVFTDSDYLYKDKIRLRSDIVRIPPGADYALFNMAARGKFKKRKVCYFGSIDGRMNFDIIKQLAGAGYEIVMVGPIRTKLPELPYNVRFTGSVPFMELPAHLMDCECLMIPYHINEFTIRIMPAKIYECLATGKPLVATPLPDLSNFDNDLVYIADSPVRFLEILGSLEVLETPEKNRKRQEVAFNNSWEARFEMIMKLLETKHNGNSFDSASYNVR